MICPKCHAPDQNGHYCTKCGTHLDDVIPIENHDDIEYTMVMSPLSPESTARINKTSPSTTTTVNTTATNIPVSTSNTDDDTELNQATSSVSFSGIEPNINAQPTIDNLSEETTTLPIIDEITDKDTRNGRIGYLVGFVIGLILVGIVGSILFFNIVEAKDRDEKPSIKTTEVTKTPVKEDVKLKDMKILNVDQNDSVDELVGFWSLNNQTVRVEKVGKRFYRLSDLFGQAVWPIHWKDDRYVLNMGDKTYIFNILKYDTLIKTDGNEIGYRLNADGSRVMRKSKGDRIIGDWLGPVHSIGSNSLSQKGENFGAAHVIKLDTNRYRIFTTMGYRYEQPLEDEKRPYYNESLHLYTYYAQVTDVTYLPQTDRYHIDRNTRFDNKHEDNLKYLGLSAYDDMRYDQNPEAEVSSQTFIKDQTFKFGMYQTDLMFEGKAISDSASGAHSDIAHALIHYWFYANQFPNIP